MSTKNTEYYFVRESYWSNPGCDCCEQIEDVFYNEIDSKILGSCDSKRECLARVLEFELDLDYNDRDVYNRTFEQLIEQLKSINVTVSFSDADHFADFDLD